MKRRFLLCVLLAGVTLAHAQMLLVEPGTEDPGILHFNPEFIARNGVRSVSGQAWVKRDGQPMRALDRHYLYRFVDGGRLGYSNNSFGKPGSGIDTASVMYTYDEAGHLLQELHNDIHGYFALRKEYDPEGRATHVEHVRLENLSSDRYRFVEGGTTIISDERYTYTTLNDSMWRRTALNDRGRPYQEETFVENALGYLRSIEKRNLITQRRGRITFTYDEKGRLAEREEATDLGLPDRSKWTWTYDNGTGNPLSRDLYRNGELVRHSEFLYTEGTLFLKAIVTRNNETGVIDIVRYETAR